MFWRVSSVVFDVAWVFSGRLGKAFFMLFLNLAVARLFGVSDYADFVLALSFFIPATYISSLGFCYYFNRYNVVTCKEFSAVFWFSVSVSALINALLVSLLFLGEILNGWLIYFLWFFLGSLSVLISEVYRGYGDIKKSVASASIVPVFLSLIFTAFYQSLLDVYVSLSIGLAFSCICFVVADRKLFLRRGWGAKGHLMLALPLLGLNFSSILAPQLLVWASVFLGDKAVAALGLATRLVFLMALPVWVVNAIAPRRVYSAKEDLASLVTSLFRVRVLLVLTFLLVYLIFSLFGERLIVGWFGIDFRQVYGVALVLGCAVFFQSLAGPSQVVLNVYGFGSLLLKTQSLMFVGVFCVLSIAVWNGGLLWLASSYALVQSLFFLALMYLVVRHVFKSEA